MSPLALTVVPPLSNVSGGLNETVPVTPVQLTVPGALPENFDEAEAVPLPTAINASGKAAATAERTTFFRILTSSSLFWTAFRCRLV